MLLYARVKEAVGLLSGIFRALFGLKNKPRYRLAVTAHHCGYGCKPATGDLE